MSITLKGDKEIRAALKELPNKVRVRVLVGANRKTMQRALRIAKSLVPEDTGQLKKSLGIRTFKNAKRGTVTATLGPRKGFAGEFQSKTLGRGEGGRFQTILGGKRRVDPQKYAHLVEFGTVKTEARPFLRPALQQVEGDIESTYAKEVFDGIEREWDKLGKGGA
jgi:HK97 gp10 family phage protein